MDPKTATADLHHHGHGHSHDHGSCAHADAAEVMACAEKMCAGQGLRLTPIRARVLEALARTARPVGAYELIDLLADEGKRHAPITVYRALEFLLENGLAHRLESRNAYLACDHTHAPGAPVIFLICDSCGTVSEAASGEIGTHLNALVAAEGFAPRSQVVEITGDCAACRSA